MRCKAGRRSGANIKHDTFTLGKPPHQFLRPVKCPVCKSTDVVSIEVKYRKAEAKREKCYCLAVPHPHKKGSHRLCEFHKLADVPLTEDEERQAMDVANNLTRTSNR